MNMREKRWAIALRLLGLVALLAGFPVPSRAEITRIAIQATQPFGDFATGKYIRLEGEALACYLQERRSQTWTKRLATQPVRSNIARASHY